MKDLSGPANFVSQDVSQRADSPELPISPCPSLTPIPSYSVQRTGRSGFGEHVHPQPSVLTFHL